MIETVVFYGSLLDPSLRRSLGVEPLLRPVRKCLLPGALYDLGPYPGLALGPSRVHGRLFALRDPAALPLLDSFEECDSDPPLFVRRNMRLIDPQIESWVYVYNRSVGGKRRLRQGKWFLRRLR